MTAPPALPAPLSRWFAARGWSLHHHQTAMLAQDAAGRSALLIAPTGGGKTLAGFLPSLVDLAADPADGLHTLYISPLKALAVDVHRNLLDPIAGADLDIRCETRTGDTPAAKRKRQRAAPPQILMTTPESLALLLSYPDAPRFFADLKRVVVDELHALAGTKRGDLLALGLTRLGTLAPAHRRVGLSATVADEASLIGWLSRDGRADDDRVALVRGRDAAAAKVEILETEARLPWSGHMATHALGEVYDRLKTAGVSIVFVNTRAQAEIVFQALWRLNDDNLPIALHHGSLARDQRRKVEAAMAAGALRAVVATSSLDLGIDWAAVDLVIQIGAPKGASRLIQRIGRSNHRLDAPSEALVVPANRFEVLECQAAIAAIAAGELDGETKRIGGLDVLAQHLMGRACSAAFAADDAYAEVRRAAPYADLARGDFDDVLGFVENGGYALRAYDRHKRIARGEDGLWRVADRAAGQAYRMNVGTIVEAETLKVKLRGGRYLGEVEEWFVQGLTPGDTFVFSGQVLRYERLKDLTLEATRAVGADPKIPAYGGGRLPLSTHLADRVRRMLQDPACWPDLPAPVRDWLALQQEASTPPPADGLLVETFPRGGKHWLVAYCFEGRNAHQTLGMLLTRRMERMGAQPLGFVATDYVIAAWSLAPIPDVAALFDEDMLGDDLDAWMAESSMLKRTFRNVAVISGLIPRKLPGTEKSGRHMTVNSDLIYDVLRAHQPDHVLLRATWADAAAGLTDLGRLADLLRRAKTRLVHRALDRVSPLAVPILLEVGREQVEGEARDALLEEQAALLLAEAAGEDAADRSAA